MTKWSRAPCHASYPGARASKVADSSVHPPPNDLFREVGLMIAARRKQALSWALQVAKLVFDEGTEENREAMSEYVLQGLVYLAEELSYGREHDDATDVPLLRWRCTQLAWSMSKAGLTDYPAVAHWLEIATSDPLPEVRYAVVPSNGVAAIDQYRPPHGAVLVNGLPEADDFLDRSPAAISAPRSATGPGGPAPPHSRSRIGWRAAFRRFNRGRFQEISRSPVSSKTCSQSASTRRWISRLLAFASLATDTRAYPYSLPIIFRWPPVLAWRLDTTIARVLAMLIFVPFRQGWPGGRPGTERCVDHIV